MTVYETLDDLAVHLEAHGIQCSVLEDGFLELPDGESGMTATIELTGGWLVFRAFLGEWAPKSEEAASRTLLILHDRLIGFRFAASGGELWALQDFPLGILSDAIELYVEHVFTVLDAILPTLKAHLNDKRSMSEEDIDVMFDRLGPNRLQ